MNYYHHLAPPCSPSRANPWPVVLGLRRAARATWLLLAALLLLGADGRAAGATQAGRFLLIFDTSAALKKNLAGMEQTLSKLLANNLQQQIQENDDLAVWTVDQSVHSGLFPLASWAPEDAAMYEKRLDDFLGQQKYSRHTELAAIQPLLNRVAKGSERLTVLIFGDTQSRLLGTPYDRGINETITNLAAKIKGGPAPLIIVLRAYHGEYVGGSVNRSLPLNFPEFPPPTPPPATNPPALAPPPTVARPAPTPVPPLILVGTNARTELAKTTHSPTPPPPVPAPLAPAAAPATNEPVSAHPPTLPASGAPANPAPVPAPPPPATAPEIPVKVVTAAPPTVIKATPAPLAPPPAASVTAPEPPAMSPPTERFAPAASSPTRPADGKSAETNGAGSELSSLTWWGLAGGLLAAAAVGLGLILRARRPRPSLITTSFEESPPPPPK